MNRIILIFLFLIVFASGHATDPFTPDSSGAPVIPGMNLVFSEEFNYNGKPDSLVWGYETGFVRNNELQWYQADNANCSNGRLLIEAKKSNFENPNYVAGSNNWKTDRKTVQYTSACIKTWNKKAWKFGRFEVRARIDTTMGAWPAIWLLGVEHPWPSCGEIDMLEFYRPKNVPSILANVAWGSDKLRAGSWDTTIHPLTNFLQTDKNWAKKFHVWRMDWTAETIKLYVDDELLNTTLLSDTMNPDGTNPFLQPQYFLLNLALGVNGGDPVNSQFPITFEVDYVRIYQPSHQAY